MQHWLKQVVVEPHLLIERIQRCDLLRSVQAEVPEILTHQRVVLLLHHAIIVLVIGTAATQAHAFHLVFPEAHQVLIEELAAVVGMQFDDRKGQALQDVMEACFHGSLPSPQHSPRRYGVLHPPQSAPPPRCPRECDPWVLPSWPDWLAPLLSAVNASSENGMCVRCVPPSPG